MGHPLARSVFGHNSGSRLKPSMVAITFDMDRTVLQDKRMLRIEDNNDLMPAVASVRP